MRHSNIDISRFCVGAAGMAMKWNVMKLMNRPLQAKPNNQIKIVAKSTMYGAVCEQSLRKTRNTIPLIYVTTHFLGKTMITQ